jgi:hypothetical protein
MKFGFLSAACKPKTCLNSNCWLCQLWFWLAKCFKIARFLKMAPSWKVVSSTQHCVVSNVVMCRVWNQLVGLLAFNRVIHIWTCAESVIHVSFCYILLACLRRRTSKCLFTFEQVIEMVVLLSNQMKLISRMDGTAITCSALALSTVLRTTSLSYGNMPFSGTHPTKTTWPIVLKFCTIDYVGETDKPAKNG